MTPERPESADLQESDQIDELFRSRPDLDQVQLAHPDGGYIDAGVLLADLKQRMTAVIDDWAHGFGFEDYLPPTEVEQLIDSGAERPLIAAAARYAAELVHSRYGNSPLAWEPTPEIEVTDYLDNVTDVGIVIGLSALDSELTRQGESAVDDPLSTVPAEIEAVADVVSAYTAVIFGFVVKTMEIESDLLGGAGPPRPHETTAARWIALDVYTQLANRVHQLLRSAPETLASWIDDHPERDHVATAEAVITWSRQQISSAVHAAAELVTTGQDRTPDRWEAAAQHLAGGLESRFDELFGRVSEAVHGASFAEECSSQDEAIGWTWQLIDTGLITYLDEHRVALCRAWEAVDAQADRSPQE